MENTYDFNMHITLEQHFENLAHAYPNAGEIHSLWVLLKKKIEDELVHSRGVFVNYSLHDATHSRTVLQAIERFLGDKRIRMLSVTDTFMILACTYAHDYGMAQTYNKIYDLLGKTEFKNFLDDTHKNADHLEKEEAWAVENLLKYLNDEKPNIKLNDMYFSIMLVIQMYLRPEHWKGVIDIRRDFEGLFSGQIKKRFIHGCEGIVEVCMCHGQTIEDLLKLSPEADGMAGDDYHPRFVAAMLRLGDLLDLDNGRFPAWFAKEVAQNKNIIPKLSILHFGKHEAVSHLLITPDKIEITAHCYSKYIARSGEENREKEDLEIENAQEECYEIAGLVSEWTERLTAECNELVMHWNEIAPCDFGSPPANLNISIYVDGMEYTAENRTLQMQMSQERVMDLLEGTSIYRDNYVGIREIIQNAIDASLLQLWNDLLQNKYSSYGLSKDDVADGLDLLQFKGAGKASIFGNYDITVEVIKDELQNKVFIVVKDKGIGISTEEIKYISDIGSSREKNKRIKKFMKGMPAWLKPSGIFGIGLQSVFQLTDRICFYTRLHNKPEYMIALNSYGRNKGKIETRELPESTDGLHHDNAIPGTNVKIAVEPKKLLEISGQNKGKLKYYDNAFDEGDELDMIYNEISAACREKIAESEYDYFNIYLETKTTPSNKKEVLREHLRKSCFCPRTDGSETADNGYFNRFLDNEKDGYYFANERAMFWDKETFRLYTLTIKPCAILTENGKEELELPDKIPNLYVVGYKFNRISNVESIYDGGNMTSQLHAGFLELDVMILDDKPKNYMNIDRDRLKDGAIDEDELLKVRRNMLERWCEDYWCADGEERDGYFDSMRESLCSFMLMFYRNLPGKLFKKFTDKYQKQINRLNIPLRNELNIKASQLWSKKIVFKVKIKETKESIGLKKEGSAEADASYEIQMENIYRLPHRLVHIEEIYSDNSGSLWYKLRLKNSDHNEIHSIKMDKAARLYDYSNAFDISEDKPLVKKLFKPDEEYKALLVNCFPRTFQAGRNMYMDINYCIKGYILSPFDDKTSEEFKEFIKGLNEGESDEEAINRLICSIKESRQFSKCVRYIIKVNSAQNSGKSNEDIKCEIEKQYGEFLEEFFGVMLNNRYNVQTVGGEGACNI